ncbi:multicopper oxidase domain-containing protein [Nonomuraea sediminis]|uniref:multicopper oxidase domain-containing protein n=1 Tax=Nonomuraea sediminis TaxID=2835864 RepID=UPI0027E07E0F|nr:multicopper oxidase domain-containing protein [Nonomuraea sediminis]
MRLTRRQALLGLGGAALTLSGCSLLRGTPQPAQLNGTARLPTPYAVPLPRPAVAKPYKSDGQADYYELVQRVAEVEILPGLRTPIWGYGGQFPGPTIQARSGRRTVVRVTNTLGVPTVTHLHGGHTPPDSDGYPTDLVQPGTHRDYVFPLEQRAATLWYHDHRMDQTGPQVWRGLAGLFLVGDEEEAALPLPHGERDVPLLICDRSFNSDGTMPYPPRHDETYMGGVLGNVILVNGAPWPWLGVDRARYRLRLLNASNARAYELALSPGGTLTQIGSDGGLLAAPRRLDRVRLAPGERADVVVDFAAYRVGDQVELRNLLGDGPQARVMRFTVERNARDDSAVPATLSRVERLDPAQATVTRDFEFSSGGPGWLINGKPFDARRVDARPRLGQLEIWRLTSDVAHPFHLHLNSFQLVSDDGPAEWKDTLELREAQTVEIITRFTGYRGRYVLHCHNLEHEDMAMMSTFEVI